MKRLAGFILVGVVAVFAVADTVSSFVSSNGFRYYSEQPRRLLLVATIGIAGGLVALGFSALSPNVRRGAKLIVLASGASFVLLTGGCLSFQLANLPTRIDPAIPRHVPWLLVISTVGIAASLWFEFYQVLKSRKRVRDE